jgi:hypothetical protein
MRIQGGCHCGNITYEADIDPEHVSLCHCTDCQLLSGSAFRGVVRAFKQNLTLRGTPKVYVKTAESGNKRVQAFCPECGTQLYATSFTEPAPPEQQVFGLRLGTVKQRDQLTPKRQVWTRSAQPWVMHLDDIPKVEKQS